ncbi:MAG: VCBS repeat-containing protein [Planctomycetaceae bacterium]|nr:VCBS repeat-containing protein [Planctomycetaceae bacterium]
MRHNHLRRRSNQQLATPAPLESRRLLSSIPIGPEFKINSYTSDWQSSPSIAMDGDGDFVVAWHGYSQDGSGANIYAQRFNSQGVPQGGEFRVNSHTSNWQNDPSIAMDASGDFVVVWHSSGQDGSDEGIYAQRYDAAGTAQGSEFLVNSYTDGVQRHAAVAMDIDGDFVIAWESYLQDGWGEGIYAQRFNSLGTPQGSEFQVHTYTSDRQTAPAVAMNADGDFVISWESYEQDGSSFGIYARQFNALGVPQGTEFRANTFTSSWQLAPSIGMDADGDFVITWYSYEQDGSDNGIYAQRYHAGRADGLGVSRSGKFYLDSNHSNTWNGTSTDTLNPFGATTDIPLVGDWNGDGYDDIGVWRNGTFYLDANGNGIWDGPAVDQQFVFGIPTDTPLAGDWNNDGKDEIGVWRAAKFYLDLDGNRHWDGPGVDTVFSFGAATDKPIVGDWNGDGTDDVGVRRNQYFYLDSNGNRMWNSGVDEVFAFGNASDTPLIGDWNGDGTDDIGVWRAGKFYKDADGSHSWNSTIDTVTTFGSTTDTPLIGYWRPKTIPAPASLPGALPPTNSSISNSTPTTQPDEQTLASLLAPPTKKRDR